MDAKFTLDDMCASKLSYGEAQRFYVRRHKRLAEEHDPPQLLTLQTNVTLKTIAGIPLDQLSDNEAQSAGNGIMNAFKGTQSVGLSVSDLAMRFTHDIEEDSSNLIKVPYQMTPANNAELSEALDRKIPANDADFEKEFVEKKGFSPENRSLSIYGNVPSITLPESDFNTQNSHATKSTSKERQALRWSRELLKLIADGQQSNIDSSVVEDGDLCNRSMLLARKRRKLQTCLSTSVGSHNTVVREHCGFQKPPALSKEDQRKWRE
ncbi:hypothetical protein L7F22_040409 [Adiantum nelumboides]|nr:hypothetical protein [Adiantum nelumboides]